MDIVLSLDSGLEVTMSNHELATPLINIDETGQQRISNRSNTRLTPFWTVDSPDLSGFRRPALDCCI